MVQKITPEEEKLTEMWAVAEEAQLASQRSGVVANLFEMRKKIEARNGMSWAMHKAKLHNPEYKKEHEEYLSSLSKEERRDVEWAEEMLDSTLSLQEREVLEKHDRMKAESKTVMYRLGRYFGGWSKR